MILVTGATGNLGNAIIRQLQKKLNFNEFSALARNPEKAKEVLSESVEVRIGDFDDSQSLLKAFEGVDKLVLISTMEQNRFKQHKNVIDAAKKAGIKHIYYTSLAIKDIYTSTVKDLMMSHFETEDYLIQSGIKYTIFRNTMYAEALPQFLNHLIKDNKLQIPAVKGKVPFALRKELGEAIANLVIESGHENKIYNLTGSKSYSMNDIVNGVNEIKSLNIEYVEITENQYQDTLNKLGFPDFVSYLHRGTVADIKADQYDFVTKTVANALGRETVSLNEIIEEVF